MSRRRSFVNVQQIEFISMISVGPRLAGRLARRRRQDPKSKLREIIFSSESGFQSW